MVILQNCTGTIIHIFIFLNIIGEPQMKTGIIDAFGENCIIIHCQRHLENNIWRQATTTDNQIKKYIKDVFFHPSTGLSSSNSYIQFDERYNQIDKEKLKIIHNYEHYVQRIKYDLVGPRLQCGKYENGEWKIPINWVYI